MDNFSIAFNKLIEFIELSPDDIKELHDIYYTQENEIINLKDKLHRRNMQIKDLKKEKQELKDKIQQDLRNGVTE